MKIYEKLQMGKHVEGYFFKRIWNSFGILLAVMRHPYLSLLERWVAQLDVLPRRLVLGSRT